MRILATGLLCLAAGLGAGCAGWSTWEDQRQRDPPPWRAVGPDDYVVRRGDTVYSIAFRHNLDYRELARWNGIGSDYRIYPGQVLRLKPPSGVAAATDPPSRPASAPGSIFSRPPAGKPAAPAAPTLDPDTSEGRYTWVWPTTAPIVRAYAIDGNRGLDFGGREGQPVLAAAPGRVVYSGNALKGYGELIIIKHDDVYLSAYGYNRVRYVKEGDVVTAGQPIAEMGRGPENRPLLHFEIRRSGKPIDPAEKLPRHPS